jgi:hypothetical protein
VWWEGAPASKAPPGRATRRGLGVAPVWRPPTRRPSARPPDRPPNRRRQCISASLDAAANGEVLSKVAVLQGLYQVFTVVVFLTLWVSRRSGRRRRT